MKNTWIHALLLGTLTVGALAQEAEDRAALLAAIRNAKTREEAIALYRRLEALDAQEADRDGAQGGQEAEGGEGNEVDRPVEIANPRGDLAQHAQNLFDEIDGNGNLSDEQKEARKARVAQILETAQDALDSAGTDENWATLEMAYTDMMNIAGYGFEPDGDVKIDFAVLGQSTGDEPLWFKEEDVRNMRIQFKIRASDGRGEKVTVEPVDAGLWQSGSIELPALNLGDTNGEKNVWESVVMIHPREDAKSGDVIVGQFRATSKGRDVRKVFIVRLK
ncbi:MAG: DUF1542 domain-containing protein [Planctomycetes bacterium]|nr:DUF1542 domain-containing protein [Planctomycetota bacterium]